MHSRLGWLLCAGLLVACGSTPQPAPVREAGQRNAKAAPKILLAPARPGHYRVRPGDTLYKIAFENNLDHRDLAAWNRLTNPDLIYAGSELRLSAPSGSAATIPPAAAQPTWLAQDPDTGPEAWVWPAQGQLLRSFDQTRGHKGIHISGSRGTPVQAAATGRVVYAGDGLRGYGNLVIIQHSKTMLSAYGHQDALLVREGERVTRGQAIGRMGDSDSDRVKLHFEIREAGKPVDPARFLPLGNLGRG